MNPERYQQVNILLRRSLELRDEERARYLAAACGDDESLRREVEARIKCDQDLGDFMEDSPAEKVFEVLVSGYAQSAVGKMINHFKVESLLGEGGGARVYKALDTKLGRHVAIKILPRDLLRDSDRQRRFGQEAHTASTLSHHNVCTIHEVGETTEDGRRYIVMEYVEGETLSQRMSRGRIKSREVIDIAIQVASALAAAHEKGIVHRDIKPANIMLGHDGIVKVLDFGLAKLTDQRASSAIAPETAGMALVTTNPGQVMGTPAYMSPEQARGKMVDARTDIWSLGCMLYEMVAGRLPFEGETINDMIASILHRDSEPPPLRQYSPEAPTELQLIVKKALRKDKEERYQSIQDMLLALKRLVDELLPVLRASTSTPSLSQKL